MIISKFRLKMRRIILLLFCIVIAEGQLNFNGNPLTENNVYTAEESQNYRVPSEPSKSRQLKPNDNKKYSASFVAESSNLFKVKPDLRIPSDVGNVHLKDVSSNNANTKLMSVMKHQASPAKPSIKVLDSTSSMQIQSREEYSANQRDSTERIRVAPRQIASSVSSEALNSFLNSQTPEESQFALDKFLQTQAQAESPVSPVAFDSLQNYNTPVNTKKSGFLPNVNQAELDLANLQPMPDPLQKINLLPMSDPLQKIYQPMRAAPWYQGMKAKYRSGMRYPYYYRSPGRFSKYPSSMNGYENYPYKSSRRYGPGPGSGPGPFSVPGPVSGPGLITGPGPVSGSYPGPPGPYPGAKVYPSVTNPPIDTNVLYSQLYSQSYDPYYYNYIGKTGKIKPWLYGKLGPREEPSMWKELYASFKKHGMKNIMNPMFLLGISIPALTLMLSAIISKRSFGRSLDGDDYISEEALNELEEKVREAIKCYENGDKKQC